MSENRVNQPKWNITNSRVYGEGMSYNLTNRVTAEKLHSTLNNYEIQIQNLESQINTTQNIDDINNQLKTVLNDLEVLKHDITLLKEKIE